MITTLWRGLKFTYPEKRPWSISEYTVYYSNLVLHDIYIDREDYVKWPPSPNTWFSSCHPFLLDIHCWKLLLGYKCLAKDKRVINKQILGGRAVILTRGESYRWVSTVHEMRIRVYTTRTNWYQRQARKTILISSLLFLLEKKGFHDFSSGTYFQVRGRDDQPHDGKEMVGGCLGQKGVKTLGQFACSTQNESSVWY